MSQAALAAQLDINPQALCRYELGQRRWPAELLPRLQSILGVGHAFDETWFLSWHDHLMRGGWHQWEVQVDPGPTWATTARGYEEFYRLLRPTRTPPLEFCQTVRMDSALEGAGYTQLCEAGAKPVFVSPVALHFPYFPLLDGQHRPLGPARRAAFLLPNDWLLIPQVAIGLPKYPVRLDCLASGPGGAWAGVEFDGLKHKQSAWDAKRDAQLKMDIWRFSQEEILSSAFVELVYERLSRTLAKLKRGH